MGRESTFNPIPTPHTLYPQYILQSVVKKTVYIHLIGKLTAN
jgi:hypothetical protein